MSRRYHAGHGGHVIALRCSFCSRQVAPSKCTALASGQTMCEQCFEWHMHAVEVLGGEIPRGCQLCGKTGETLAAEQPGDQVRLYVVPKDGIYQIACPACMPGYAVKRGDLYGETQFGRDLKLAP